jgi:assimilatory nitrate reductase catalytic subunit
MPVRCHARVTALTMRQATKTHCPYCALQCGMVLRPHGTDDVGGVHVGTRDFPTNRGGLCRKGWTAAELLTSAQRLTQPLMRERRDEPLREVSWEQALDRIVVATKRAQDRCGRDAVGVFGGGGLTNEKAYLLGKFARVALRTSMIDYNGRFCMSSAATAGQRAFGLDRGLPFPVEDIARAQCILLVGANVAETMPPIMRHFAEQRAAGGRLVVVDPRRTPTAEHADLHLQPMPGSDLALAHGLLHLLIEQGFVDQQFVRDRTAGFADVRALVAGFWPERVERLTGVPVQAMREAVQMLGSAASAMVLTARGAEQHATGTDTVLAFINLALALGQAGRMNAGYGAITGQGNGQGGREHGQKADQLPGYRRIDDPAARAHVADVWGVDVASLPGPGVSAYEMLDALGTDDGVRSLLVFGSNPVVSAPNACRIEDRLRSLDFLAVSDVVLSETAELADVVLPVTQWAEETGTLTNLEGRVILRRKAIDPPGGVRTDLEVLAELAHRLGCTAAFPTDPEAAFDELRRASAGGKADYAGISYARIDAENGVFWPCRNLEDPGTPRLFLDRFATDDGRARFHAVNYRGPAEVPDADYPLFLTTGRVLAHYQSGAQTRRIGELSAAVPRAYVELHPSLAQHYAIGNGDDVRVSTRRGTAVLEAKVTGGIRSDTLFVPFHWDGKGRANSLTNPALDPSSKMPEFKSCAARIEKASV